MSKKLHQRSSREEFEQVLVEAMDEALTSLGENPKKSIYLFLEQQFKIKRQQIPYRLEDFKKLLEHVFGSGTRQLEILFMKNFHGKVGGSCKWGGPRWLAPDLKFIEYVKMMKLSYEDQGKIGEVEVFTHAGERQEHT